MGVLRSGALLRRRAGVLCCAAALTVTLACFAATSPALAAGRCGSAAQRPWCNTLLSPDRRADLLLAALTSDERISLLAGDDFFSNFESGPNLHTGTSDGVPRVGLPNVYFTDGPVGVRQGPATALPIPMALAATFDRRLAYQHGRVIGSEARDKGNDVVFAPTVNIMRTPLGGRSFEAYGEDPYLDASMTVPWIEGAQSQGVIATVKHFAANNQEGDAGPAANQIGGPGGSNPPEGLVGGRLTVNAVVDQRTLHEIYLPHFEAAVRQAHVGSVMCAYNRLNGTYACENRPLLTDILRRQWGFDGFVVADYGAAKDTGPSLKNGLDFDPWPGIAYSPELVRLALASGQATMADVDRHVHQILRTLFAFRFFDRPAYRNDDGQINKRADAARAQAIEESAITLLRNRGALPLRGRRLKSVAVIGADADTFKTGGGSAAVTPFFYTTPLAAITRRAGRRVHVHFDDGSNADSAAALAHRSSVAVVFASDYETEGVDRYCLTLECPNTHGDQDGLIEKVAAANRNTIVVLETGAPVLTPWRGQVKALLEAWYPGEQGGAAIARVLFGDVDPSGRLPATFPASESAFPTAGDIESYPGVADNVYYKEGVMVGYRWYDSRGVTPAFPFGFGLSYTSFRFSGLRVRRRPAGGAEVSLSVTNVGRLAGSAVPELYVGLPAPGASVPEPPRQLKGFTKVALKPHQRRRVSFTLDSRAFSYWDVRSGGWRIARGCDRVMVGSSSRSLPLVALVPQAGARCGRGPADNHRRRPA